MMAEFSYHWNNDEEIIKPVKKKNKVKVEVKNPEIVNEHLLNFKEIEDPFEEYNDFNPSEDNNKIFKEFNEFSPTEAVTELSPRKTKCKEINYNLKIKSLPKKARNIICEEIYKKLNENSTVSNSIIVKTIIQDIRNIKKQPNWISKIQNTELKEVRIKLSKISVKNDIENSFVKYFYDLANLVEHMRNLIKKDQPINFSKLSRNLIEQGLGLNLTKRGLEEIISGVYTDFKQNLEDFKLERVKRKPISGTESEKESIRCLRKEYKLLIEIYNGQFAGKCSISNCNTDFTRLPAFDFHHEESNIKTISWNEIMHKKYYEIKKTLEAQKVKPICKNCHLPKNAKIFNDFKSIILKKDLFTFSSKDIDKLINLEVNNYKINDDTNYTAASLKIEVKRWIKKRAVIEQIFNGKCVSCGENRLPSLQTHHTNQDLKVHRWGDISRKWSIKELINDYIIQEECACLCGNCHAMINTKNFENNVDKVLGDKYDQEVKEDYYKIKSAIMKDVNRIKKIKNGICNLTVKDYLK